MLKVAANGTEGLIIYKKIPQRIKILMNLIIINLHLPKIYFFSFLNGQMIVKYGRSVITNFHADNGWKSKDH